MTSSRDDICAALDRHTAARPDRLALRFLHDGEVDGAATELTFAALRARAWGVAAALQQRLAPGDRALLLYEGGVDFVTAFLGCLYAGIVAVPAYPPDPRRIHRTLPRLRAIVADARAELVLASADILDVAEPICAQADGLRDLIWLGPGAIEHGAARPRPHAALASDLAFLQYTSGSTGDPKGVMITRDNLAWACSVAAFSLDLDGEERVALVAEVDPARLGGDSPDDLLRKLRLAIAEELDVAVHDLALIRPRSIFKTSSGKIQRRRTRAALAAEELPILARWTAPRPAARPAAFSGADLERRL